jgi:hypothetical protein
MPRKPRVSKTSACREKLIAALLEKPTVREAARLVGLDESTAYHWLADPHFQRKYRKARRQVIEGAVSRVQQLTAGAAAAMARCLVCHGEIGGSFADELRAAKLIFDQALKGLELYDLVEELEAVKERLAEVERRHATGHPAPGGSPKGRGGG